MPDRRYSRTPDTVGMLSACALSGAVLAVTRTVPTSVEDIVPWPLGFLWAVLLAVSALVSLVGLYHQNQMTGWLLELTGRSLLAGTAGAYCLALVVVADSWGSAVIVLLAASVALGSAYRVLQVVRRLEQVREAIREAVDG